MATKDDLQPGHVRDPDGNPRPLTLREAIALLERRKIMIAFLRDQMREYGSQSVPPARIVEEMHAALASIHWALDAIARGIGAS